MIIPPNETRINLHEVRMSNHISGTSSIEVNSHEAFAIGSSYDPILMRRVPRNDLMSHDDFEQEDGLIPRMIQLLDNPKVLVPSRNAFKKGKLEFPAGVCIGVASVDAQERQHLSLIGRFASDRVGRLKSTYVDLTMKDMKGVKDFLEDLHLGSMDFFRTYVRKWFVMPDGSCELDNISGGKGDLSAFPAADATIDAMIIGKILGNYPKVDANARFEEMLIDTRTSK